MTEPSTAPRNELEDALAGIWREVLGVSTVGIYDYFYDLGGHSLLAVSVAAKISALLHVDFQVADVERLQTIASQAEAIGTALAECDGASAATAQPVIPES